MIYNLLFLLLGLHVGVFLHLVLNQVIVSPTSRRRGIHVIATNDIVPFNPEKRLFTGLTASADFAFAVWDSE